MESRQDTYERTSGSTSTSGNVTNRLREVGKQGVGEVKEVLSRIAPSSTTAGYGMNRWWRGLLLSETILFAFFGLYALMFPLRTLEMHRYYANMMNWGGPASTVASNSLQMYVQLCGAFAFSMAILSFLACTDPNRDPTFARMNSISKGWLGMMLLYYSYFGHGKTTSAGSYTTFKGLLPIALYCLVHAGLLFLSSGSFVWLRERWNMMYRMVVPGGRSSGSTTSTSTGTRTGNVQVNRVHAE